MLLRSYLERMAYVQGCMGFADYYYKFDFKAGHQFIGTSRENDIRRLVI